EVKHVPVAGARVRQIDVRRTLQPRGVSGRPLNAFVVPRMDMFQLRAENTGVYVIKPAVEAEAVDVPLVRAVVPQLADPGVDLRVVREERPAIAERAQVLLDDEADRRRVAQLGDLETVARCIDRLS